MSSSNRRVIQDDSDSDDDDINNEQQQQQQQQEPPPPIQADNNNPTFFPSTLQSIATSSHLSSFLVLHSSQEYHLNKEAHEDFINTIHDPASSPTTNTHTTTATNTHKTTTTTEHEIMLIVETLRRSEKKVRIKLFKQNKAHVVFGTWWDYCLDRLQKDEAVPTRAKIMQDTTVFRILMALLKFVGENMADVIKTGGDLGKAKARWGVDLGGAVRRTNEWLLRTTGERLGPLKEEMALVIGHCKEVWDVDIRSSNMHAENKDKGASANPLGENHESRPHQSALSRQVSETTKSSVATEQKEAGVTPTDRKEAAALARLEAMRNQRSRRFAATTTMNFTAGGRRDESSTNNLPQSYGRKPPPESSSVNNRRVAPSKSYAGSDYGRRSYDAPPSRNHGGSGWERSSSSAPDNSTFASKSNGDAGWGRSSSANPAAESASARSDNSGWGRNSSATTPQNNDSDSWGKLPSSASIVNNKASNPENHSANHGQAIASRASVPGDGWGRASSSVAAVTKGDSVTHSVGHGSDGWGRSDPSSNEAAVTSSSKMKSASADNAGWDKTEPTSNNFTASNQNDPVDTSGRSVSDGWSKDTPSSNVPAAMSSSTMTSASGNNDGWGRAESSSNVVTPAIKSDQGAISSSHVSDGWSRNTSSSNVAGAPSSSTMTSASANNDGWGKMEPSSNVTASTQSNPVADSGSRLNDGWGRSAPSSNVASAPSSSTMTSAPANNDGWGNTGSSLHSTSVTSSVARTSVPGNDDEWSRPRGREISPFSGANKSSSNGAYDSLTNRLPLRSEVSPPNSARLEPYNSSDHNPSHREGDIRNNQPLGSTGYRNNDSLHQQSHSYAPNRDDNSVNHSRHRSYDKEDSRLSYQSRTSDRHQEDRRDYDDRRGSDRSSAFRSDSPTSSRDKCQDSRRYEENYGGNSKDRYDDRNRWDRDDSSRGSNAPKRCSYFFSEKGCRSGSNCRFLHDEDDRKPSLDRRNERGGHGRRAEEDDRYDRGSEDGEVRPTKRFRGNENGNLKANAGNTMSSPPPVGGAGRGRGRGANVNLPAWMTNSSLSASAGPTGASSSSINETTTSPSLSNVEPTDSLSFIPGNNPSVAPAGRGSGRGNVDNRPAWMTRGTNGQSGPVRATGNSISPVVADRMSGRFAPPSSAQKNEIQVQPAPMGRV
ncbi:hypothetical protein ACHAWX_007637 [Stephanocyclus meneghinianus]